MPNYQKKLAVKPGSKIRLKHFDPSYHGKHESHKAALPEIEENRQKMDELQYLMYAEDKHSLLIVLQGLDAGGKDGVVRHVFTGMNPHVPSKGSVVIFNRSHYEDVLVARVHGLVPEKIWAKRYNEINDFERLITTENSTTILKFFLHISKEEQLARFKKRLEDSARQWKISESDYKEREYWDEYTKAFEDVLTKTSTDHALWFIIPSNRKWFRDLAISQIIVQEMEAMEMQFPKPTVNLAEIRRKYHEAASPGKANRHKKR